MRLAVLVSALALTACSSRHGDADAADGSDPGDDAGLPDADPDAALVDGPDIDAPDVLDAAIIPPPPVLGAQLDRAGRPLIGSVLIGALSDEPNRTTVREAYGRAGDPATWRTTLLRTNTTIEDELEFDLARFDAIDKGFVAGNNTLMGCQNGFRYSLPVRPESYQNAAALFADDQLYIDTAKASCGVYLSLEIELASGATQPHTACGGRTPSHDVVDVTYSVIAAGLDGLDVATGTFNGRIRDGVTVHTDVKTTFPFLGAPH